MSRCHGHSFFRSADAGANGNSGPNSDFKKSEIQGSMLGLMWLIRSLKSIKKELNKKPEMAK